MKIGLVYPGKRSIDKQMPLGLGYLASFLLSKNAGIEIRVLDTGIANKRETASFFADKYDIVGISVTTRAFTEAVEIAKTLKQISPGLPVVFGGPHVSIMMQQVMEEPLIDFGVYGEGELTFNELVKLFREDSNRPSAESFAKIKGLIYRNNGGVAVPPPRELIQDLDSLPFPAFHLFPIERYPGKHQMITSRGCPFSCVFCASSQIWKRKWRARSPENIVAEVEYLIKTFRPRPIDFHDDNFNVSRKRLNAICDLFIGRNLRIPWSLWGFRAEVVDADIARKMRRAGCTNVAIGVESANNEMLVRMGKNVTIEQINTCIDFLHSAGIDVIGQFMIGNPDETLETVRESIKFIKESKLSKANWGCAVPFPSTGLWDYVQECGHFLVEPDCTRFEEIEPRLIFETPDFSKEDRLAALRLVRDAGMLPSGSEFKSLFRKLKKAASRIWFKYIYGYLPRCVSYRLYFFLRILNTKVSRSRR